MVFESYFINLYTYLNCKAVSVRCNDPLVEFASEGLMLPSQVTVGITVESGKVMWTCIVHITMY